MWKIADNIVLYVGVSVVIARIGCFLNGCCFGVVSNLPWAVRYPLFSEAHLYQISRGQTNLLVPLPVHPTQLYEALGVLVSVVLALWVRKARPQQGLGIVTLLGFLVLSVWY